VGAGRSTSFRAALRNRDFRRLLSALAVSTAGDWIYGTALIVFVFEETRSVTWVAAASILRLIPYVLFGTLGGVIADRYEKRRVMVLADVSRAGLMFLLAAVAASSGPVAVAIAITFISTAAGTPFGPALAATTPSVVKETDLSVANAALSTVEHTALVLGPAIGGLLLIFGSPTLAFAVNGVTFLASAASIARIQMKPEAAAEGERSTLVERVVEGLRAIGSSGQVSILVVFFIAVSLVYGFELVLLILVSERLLDTGAEGVGFLNAAIGLGGVLAAGIASRLVDHPRSALSLSIAILVAGVPLMLLSIVRVPLLAYVLLTVEGAGSIVLDVMTVTMLQRLLRKEVTARVFGVLDSLSVAGILLGSLLAPPLVNAIGLKTTLIGVGALLPLVAAALFPRVRALDRQAADRMRETAADVDVLSSLPVFEGAQRHSLEILARALAEQTVEAGETVITEGEPAEDFYVVRSGSYEVLSAGETGSVPRVINTLGEGDYFGEIGLVEGIPRTATVRAATGGVVYRISGPDFLDAVNESPTLSGTLLDGIVGRLARTHPSYEPRTQEAIR
jgi:predicted MFS family arabinose efflux permease